MFSKKTKRLLLTATVFLITLCTLTGIGLGVHFTYNWLMEVSFGQLKEGNNARVVVDVCAHVVFVTIFIYFSYKWLIKK